MPMQSVSRYLANPLAGVLAANMRSVSRLTTLAANGSLAVRSVSANVAVPAGVGEVLPPDPGNLLAEYRFDEGSGSTVIDYSGNGNNATVAGGGVLGPYGLTVGYANTPVPMSSVLSILLYLSPDGTAAGAVAAGASGGANPQFSIINTVGLDEGQTSWRVNKISPFEINSGAEMSSAAWPMSVAFVLTGGIWTIYVNGTEAGIYDQSDAGVSFTPSGDLRLFADASGTSFEGLLCHCLLYSSALTATEVMQGHRYARSVVAGRGIPDTGPRTRTTPLAVLCGNSLTNNEDVSQIDLKQPVAKLKSAIPGGLPSDVLAKCRQAVIPLYRPLATGNIVGLWPTPNTLDAAAVLLAATTAGDDLRAAGFNVYLKGPLAAGGGWDAIKPIVQADYLNPTTGWASFADAFIDFSGDAAIYADGSYSGAPDTYWLDNVHITQAAYEAFVYTPERNTIAAFLPPVADFTPSAFDVAGSTSITFTTTSVGTVTTYAWTFGDGGTSSSASPSHSYASDGSYDVTLTVTGPLGTSSITRTVTRGGAAAIQAMSPFVWITAGPGYATKAAGGNPAIGDMLASWVDRSGNNRGPTQTATGDQPTLQQVSGQYVIRFDKTRGDFLQWDAATFDSLTTGAEIFIVERVTDGGAVQGHWQFGTGAQDYYGFGGDIYDGFGSTARKGPYAPSVTLTDLHVFSVRSVSGEHTCRMDGAQIGTTATNTVGWTSVCKVGTGSLGTTGGREVCDLIILPPLSDPERATVLAYLQATWGTP